MKRRALTSFLALSLLAALVACGTAGPPPGGGPGGGDGNDPFATVRPYAEQAFALATMQYGLGLMALVGQYDLPPVDFGGFSLERHTVSWLGILGVELLPASPPLGTVTTLRSGDGDGDGYPWVVRSYDLTGTLPTGSTYTLSGAAGLGEFVADDDASAIGQVFDAGAEGEPLVLEVGTPASGVVARWKIADATQSAWSQTPTAIDYAPAIELEVEQQSTPVGRMELRLPSGLGHLQASYETATSRAPLEVHPSGSLAFSVTESGRARGPVQLTVAVSATTPLVLDDECFVMGTRTAGLVSGKVYYLDPVGDTVALVEIKGCGQYEVETFF